MIRTVIRKNSEVPLRIFLFIFIVFACSPTAQQSKGSSKVVSSKIKQQTDLSKQTETNTTNKIKAEEPAPEVEIPKVDGSKLRVFSPVVSKMTEGGNRSDVLAFSASGQAQYVLWKLCPEEDTVQTATCVETDSQSCGAGGACVQNVTPYNRVLFPRLFAGKVTISLKACVDPESAIDPEKACGESTDIEYDSHYNNTEVQGLFAKRQGYLDALTRLGEEKRKLYFDYKGDLVDCMKFDMKNEAFYRSKIAAVDGLINGVFFKMFTWGPKKLIEELNKTSVGHTLIEGAKSAVGAVKDTFKKVADGFCKLGETTGTDTACLTNLKDSNTTMTQTEQNEYCKNAKPNKGAVGSFCGMVGTLVNAAAGMLSSMNPAESIAVLSDAIHNAINPEAAVSRTCLAEQKFAKGSEQIDKNAVVLTDQLIEVNNKLRALGEL